MLTPWLARETANLNFFFFPFRATPAAYGSSQAKGPMWDLSLICDLHHSSRQRWILNRLSEARDQTCIFMDTSQIWFCCTMMGTPTFQTFYPHCPDCWLDYHPNTEEQRCRRQGQGLWSPLHAQFLQTLRKYPLTEGQDPTQTPSQHFSRVSSPCNTSVSLVLPSSI